MQTIWGRCKEGLREVSGRYLPCPKSFVHRRLRQVRGGVGVNWQSCRYRCISMHDGIIMHNIGVFFLGLTDLASTPGRNYSPVREKRNLVPIDITSHLILSACMNMQGWKVHRRVRPFANMYGLWVSLTCYSVLHSRCGLLQPDAWPCLIINPFGTWDKGSALALVWSIYGMTTRSAPDGGSLSQERMAVATTNVEIRR